MRVLYDSQIFAIRQYGGISRYFVELASRISNFPDVEAQVLSPLMCSLFLAEKRSQVSTVGLNLSRIPHLSTRVVRQINALLSRACAPFINPDIVHETYYTRRRNAPRSAKIVTTIHDTIPERFPNFFHAHTSHRTTRRAVLRRADRVICVSESTRRDVLELYDLDPDRVSVVGLGSSIAPVSEAPMDIGAPYFLHVGGRYPYKNFTGLLKAFGEARLHKTHKLVSFTSTPLSANELAVMQQAGVPQSNVVLATGDDQTLARYYAGAEALVFPSMYEGFGIPLLEAMCCNCPIVTSNTSSLPEVAGDAAIYCDPYDIKSISDALIEIASSPATRARLLANGRERVRNFSWERCASETRDVYKTLAS
jgi:glycosyltransferase involved in cell wall biosynthesis